MIKNANRTNAPTEAEIKRAAEFIAWRNEYEMTAKFRPFGMTVEERFKAEAAQAAKTGDMHAWNRASRGLAIFNAYTH